MRMPSDVEIEADITALRDGFYKLTRKIGQFNILDEKLVPEGLKPHTRSISWLAEQVIKQQARLNLTEIGFVSVVDASSDIEQYDCIVNVNGREVLINLKVTAAKSQKGSRNDINKAYKLFKIFQKNKDTLLYYVIFKIKFKNTNIIFSDKDVIVFYVPWINEVYVNPSNHHLQANYEEPMHKRSVDDFLDLVDKEITIKKIPRK